MAGYLSSILTSTTSRYNNLRRNLLSDEADGDTENDSHISRVLRAYYTEKGRPFPAWLPPDSNSTPPVSAQYSQVQHRQQPNRAQNVTTQGRSRSALSDLWDSPAQQPQQTQPAQPLRGSAMRTATAGQRDGPSTYANSQQPTAPMGARPLPSQREGSYQSAPSFRSAGSASSNPSPMGSASGGGTAQDKLKAKLWGAPRP